MTAVECRTVLRGGKTMGEDAKEMALVGVRGAIAAMIAATARMTSAKVSRRLPNSTYLCHSSSCRAVGV